jgi:hypothetical protein
VELAKANIFLQQIDKEKKTSNTSATAYVFGIDIRSRTNEMANALKMLVSGSPVKRSLEVTISQPIPKLFSLKYSYILEQNVREHGR